MKLSIDIRTTLTQTLTPQQIQYLKLLQLPLVQLEQQVKQEIEANPMLEEVMDIDVADVFSDDFEGVQSPEILDVRIAPSKDLDVIDSDYSNDNYVEDAKEAFVPDSDFYDEPHSRIDDERDPFEYYQAIWQDEADFNPKRGNSDDYDDYEPFQIKDNVSLIDDLYQQLNLLRLSDEDLLLGSQIIGNIDDDGYLRRELQEIVDETNSFIANHNFEIQKKQYESQNAKPKDYYKDNPARMFALSEDSAKLLSNVHTEHPELTINLPGIELFKKYLNESKEEETEKILKQVNLDQAERLLKLIQSLDPPGIGSRSIQECLVSQAKSFHDPNPYQKLALEILANAYEAFAKKHYHLLLKQFDIDEHELKEAIEVIRRLNPKPGGGDFQSENNTVIPDFLIARQDETGELMITINDANMPQIKLSSAYERLKKDIKSKQFNKETREWVRNKYEDAKFLIQAIRQRKATMLKVMTAIAHAQISFFDEGRAGLKPLIYKDVSEATGLDISTVCRIVNGKYVQTQYGTFELKFFFSESLPTDDGEDVSTTVIKEIIKDIIDNESKSKPHSDDKISDLLKEKGYNVARRTVAKYREQMRVPVARLRKEL